MKPRLIKSKLTETAIAPLILHIEQSHLLKVFKTVGKMQFKKSAFQ